MCWSQLSDASLIGREPRLVSPTIRNMTINLAQSHHVSPSFADDERLALAAPVEQSSGDVAAYCRVRLPLR